MPCAQLSRLLSIVLLAAVCHSSIMIPNHLVIASMSGLPAAAATPPPAGGFAQHGRCGADASGPRAGRRGPSRNGYHVCSSICCRGAAVAACGAVPVPLGGPLRGRPPEPAVQGPKPVCQLASHLGCPVCMQMPGHADAPSMRRPQRRLRAGLAPAEEEAPMQLMPPTQAPYTTGGTLLLTPAPGLCISRGSTELHCLLQTCAWAALPLQGGSWKRRCGPTWAASWQSWARTTAGPL